MAQVGSSEQETSGAGQEDVIAFLSDPRSYPQVERLETHGNAACIGELVINQRFGSPLYLDCVPIARSRAGVLAFGRNGEIVEWTVHMRRFDQAALPSTKARNTGITNASAADLADVVYAAHQLAEREVTHSSTPPLPKARRFGCKHACQVRDRMRRL
jgi:aminoglycoside phosphotransferase family enzyme